MTVIYIILALVVLYFVDKALKKVKPIEPQPKAKRTRTKKGRFVADDPSTPQNEAWVGGKSPKKKAAKKATKKATKKVVKKTTPKNKK